MEPKTPEKAGEQESGTGLEGRRSIQLSYRGKPHFRGGFEPGPVAENDQRSDYVAPTRYVRIGGKRRATPEYASWRDAVHRCSSPRARAYPRYGGRGIRVCERWTGVGGFDRFFEDMGPRPEGHSLDRIDNDGDYEPDNCRWASEKAQQRNRRDNRRLTIGDETMCLVAWAERAGLPRRTLAARIHCGWAPSVAVSAARGARKGVAHRDAGVKPARSGRVGWGRSKFRGVHRSGAGWGAIIIVHGEQRWLGTYPSAEDAARAYDSVAREHHIDPVLNFPGAA